MESSEKSVVELKLLRRWPVEHWTGLTIVIGCSGGADSVALVVVLSAIAPPSTTLVVAHWNYRLRGAESDADRSFVRGLASRLDLEFVEGSSAPQLGIDSIDDVTPIAANESTLRDTRYRFFEETANRMGARYVAVGHQADDQVETVLHNLFRGSGLNGLCGIAPFRDFGPELVLVRPLIDIWRTEILSYLKLRNQAFRVDSSNASRSYTRNRIRNRLLPIIQEEFGRDVRPAIFRAAENLAECRAELDDLVKKWSPQGLVDLGEDGFQISIPHARQVAWRVVQQAIVVEYQRRKWGLQAYGQSQWLGIRGQLEGSARSIITYPDSIEICRHPGVLSLKKLHK